MNKIKFLGEPNQTVTVNLERIILNFDENGEMFLSEDHPALERMKMHFQHEGIANVHIQTTVQSVEPGQEEVSGEEHVDSLKCPRCGFEAASKSGLTAHIRAKHKE